MSDTDNTIVSAETRQQLRQAFPDRDLPTDEEILEWVEAAGEPEIDRHVEPGEEGDAAGEQ